MLRVRERRQFGEVSQDIEVDMVDIFESIGEVALVDIGDLQDWHIFWWQGILWFWKVCRGE